jgi:hypothetical protein
MFRVIALWVVAALLSYPGQTLADASPVGNWNLKIKVGHVGEGIRVVIMQITEKKGELDVRVSRMNGQLEAADEFNYENGRLYVAQGAYEYTLTFDKDTVKGTVVSPAGEQEITGKRQESIRMGGDEGEPLRRSWRGMLERKDDRLIVKTGQGYELGFLNPEEFRDDLTRLEGTRVEVTGWWIKTGIKIQKIEPLPTGQN